eukprot:scaffold1072_cov356-Prasinococcus_capsulatus_cf.AAC.3
MPFVTTPCAASHFDGKRRVDHAHQHREHNGAVSGFVKGAVFARGRCHNERELAPRGHGKADGSCVSPGERFSKEASNELADRRYQERERLGEYVTRPQILGCDSLLRQRWRADARCGPFPTHPDGNLEADRAGKEDFDQPGHDAAHARGPYLFDHGQRAEAQATQERAQQIARLAVMRGREKGRSGRQDGPEHDALDGRLRHPGDDLPREEAGDQADGGEADAPDEAQ